MIENDPSARFKVVSRAELYLAETCMVCRSPNRDEGYVNLDTFFDYEGNMYMCLLCAQELARTIGYLDPAEVEMMQSIASENATRLVELEAELNVYRPIIDQFRDGLSSVTGDPVDLAVTAESAAEPEHDAEPVEHSTDREPEVTESSPFAGSSNSSRVKSRNITSK